MFPAFLNKFFIVFLRSVLIEETKAFHKEAFIMTSSHFSKEYTCCELIIRVLTYV